MGVAFATILRPLAAVKHKYKKKTSAFWHNTKDSFPTLFRNTLLSTHAHTHTHAKTCMGHYMLIFYSIRSHSQKL